LCTGIRSLNFALRLLVIYLFFRTSSAPLWPQKKKVAATGVPRLLFPRTSLHCRRAVFGGRATGYTPSDGGGGTRPATPSDGGGGTRPATPSDGGGGTRPATPSRARATGRGTGTSSLA